MRAVAQRVSEARVTVNGAVIGEIGQGLAVLLGVRHGDSEADADYLAEKVAGLRVFHDDEGKMNRSVLDIGGELLVVSQFTLFGDVRRGKRPSFTEAAPPDHAKSLYDYFVRKAGALGVRRVATGEFQASMQVSLTNSGPVTILLDSRKAF